MDLTSLTIVMAICIIALFLLTFFVIGVIFGWLANRHAMETSIPNLHPEMFDSHGNIIPDEILAVRFENDDMLTDEEEEII